MSLRMLGGKVAYSRAHSSSAAAVQPPKSGTSVVQAAAAPAARWSVAASVWLLAPGVLLHAGAASMAATKTPRRRLPRLRIDRILGPRARRGQQRMDFPTGA